MEANRSSTIQQVRFDLLDLSSNFQNDSDVNWLFPDIFYDCELFNIPRSAERANNKRQVSQDDCINKISRPQIFHKQHGSQRVVHNFHVGLACTQELLLLSQKQHSSMPCQLRDTEACPEDDAEPNVMWYFRP